MNGLLIANTISAGYIFMIWSKNGLLNLAFKGLYLTLLVLNVIALARG